MGFTWIFLSCRTCSHCLKRRTTYPSQRHTGTPSEWQSDCGVQDQPDILRSMTKPSQRGGLVCLGDKKSGRCGTPPSPKVPVGPSPPPLNSRSCFRQLPVYNATRSEGRACVKCCICVEMLTRLCLHVIPVQSERVDKNLFDDSKIHSAGFVVQR